jgi:hypothetical protein
LHVLTNLAAEEDTDHHAPNGNGCCNGNNGHTIPLGVLANGCGS